VGTAKSVSSVNRLLRQIKRLKAQAAPLIAERDRRQKHWLEEIAPRLAEDHLIRVILVFRDGEPRIDEPLALACERVLSKLKSDSSEPLEIPTSRALLLPLCGGLERNDPLKLKYMDLISKSEPPAEHVKSKIATWVRQMPHWLRHLCFTTLSMTLLGLAPPAPADEDALKLQRMKSDWTHWPLLPQGILEPQPDYGRFVDQMSLKEAITYLTINEKPEKEWTRREHRFTEEMFARVWSMQRPDKHD
jgi:hypothetical protein